MKVRIQKLLARAGIDSRRHVEEMVLEGRVSVNGKKVRSLPVMVDEMADRIEVDGTEVYAPPKARRGRGGSDNAGAAAANMRASRSSLRLHASAS